MLGYGLKSGWNFVRKIFLTTVLDWIISTCPLANNLTWIQAGPWISLISFVASSLRFYSCLWLFCPFPQIVLWLLTTSCDFSRRPSIHNASVFSIATRSLHFIKFFSHLWGKWSCLVAWQFKGLVFVSCFDWLSMTPRIGIQLSSLGASV